MSCPPISITEVTPGITVGARRIPAGHKVAVRAHAKGEPIRRYGQIIGFATDAIEPGAWVHTHNCEMGDFSRDWHDRALAQLADCMAVVLSSQQIIEALA